MGNERDAHADRRARLAIVGIIGLGVLLRLLVLPSPGFPSDVGTFQAWAERLVQLGPQGFYEPGYFSDYPPGYLYVLWLFGALFDGEFLRLAVKAASIPADIAIAVIGASLAWRSAGRARGMLAAGLWMLSPGPIFAGPYWGQVDAVGTVPFMLALILAGRGRWSSAGALAGVALMVKPQFGIALIVVLAAAVVVWLRDVDWRPSLRTLAASAGAVLLLGLPFRSGPAELIALVRSASETYPYTSLYAFNVWSLVGDFWKPDDRYVVTGGLMLLGGIAAACALTWQRRDVATLLAAGALAAFAFYFLPTRAHERYLFPAFALLLPLAAVRSRLLLPYVALAVSFATTLYFAFTRYPQNDLRSPEWLEQTLFARNGQIALALLMLAVAAYLAWRLWRTDASLQADGAATRHDVAPDLAAAAPVPHRRQLPALLSLGGPPTRRDFATALLIALVVLGTRGYRLDQPRDMYFDEVYHARTAFELLAQRDPYEWTHPHLAKEIMALGIVAFAGDRVVGAERAPAAPVAFTVTNDGRRVFGDQQGRVHVIDRDGRGGLLAQAPATPRAIAAADGVLYIVTDVEVCSIAIPPSTELGEGRSRAFEHCAALPARGTSVGIVLAGGRVVVATTTAVYLYTTLASSPTTVAEPALALAAKPDASQIFVLQAGGVVRLIDPTSGNASATLSAKGPATAIAYAQSANRLYLARADTPALDIIDIAGRSTDTVPLANARTGAFVTGATALAMVPRTQFLYALADGRVVVVETHGASPYAAIAVAPSDRFLGVDGEGDALVVAGGDAVTRIETGRHALAWRLPGVLFAALLAFFLVLLARRLFASPQIAYLAGAAVVLDGSMFAQARIGMNDIYVTTFIVAAWYFIVAAHRPRRAAWMDLVLAGALVGLGAASKWAAVYTLAGILVAAVVVTARAYERGRPGTGGPLDLLAGRGRNAALLFGSFAVIPAVLYLGAYQPWFGGPMAPYGWNLWELTQQMYWYHSSLTSPHCAGAPWWSWPVDLKPVYWYFGQSSAGTNGYIYDAGNPILFWAALPASMIVGGLAIRARSVALALVVFAMLTQFVAWIPISRVLFFYHFFTALPFYLLALAVVLGIVWDRRRTAAIAFLAVAAAVFVFFYPFVSGLPIPGDLAGVYFILPTWQYDPAFYPTESCSTPVSAHLAASLTVAVAWAYELGALSIAVMIALDVPLARRALGRLGL